MENFSVKLSGVSLRIEEEQYIINSLSSLGERIQSVRSGLNYQIKSRDNLQNVLNRLADDVNGYKSDVQKMRTALKNIHSQYEKTERRICGYVNDHPISLEDIWKAVTTVGEGLSVSALFPWAGLGWLAQEILNDEEWKKSGDVGSYEHTLWDKFEKDKKDNIFKEHYELENGKWVKKEKKESSDGKKTDAQKRKELFDDITIWSGSVKKEGSLLHLGKDGDVETDWGKYSYSADIMQAEAHASASVTMGGVNADVGVAVSAFTAQASAQLGSDMLGVHGDVGVDVGRAEAKAKVAAGWLDKDGNLDVNLGVSASAEAIAAEIKGTVGADILGADVDVTGSLNFGIGAHADFGYMDGKLSMDLGASLGVGGSVKLEIDVSGTVDIVVDCVSDIGGTAMEACRGAQEFLGNAANAVGDFAGSVMDGVGDTLSSGWSAFKSWFG